MSLKRAAVIILLFASAVGAYAAESEANPWQAEWVWHPKPTRFGYFRKIVHAKERPVSAKIAVTADNIFTLYVNGRKIGHDDDWTSLHTFDVTPEIKPGANVVAVAVEDPGADIGGLLLEGAINYPDGSFTLIKSDKSWRLSSEEKPGWTDAGFDDSEWSHPKEIGKPPIGPWGGLVHPQLVTPVKAEAVAVSWPEGAKPGDTLKVTVSVKPERKIPSDGPLGLKLTSNGETVYEVWKHVTPAPSEWKPGETATVKLSGVYLPIYLPTGKLQAHVIASAADISGAFDVILDGGRKQQKAQAARLENLSATLTYPWLAIHGRVRTTRALDRESDRLYIRIFRGKELWYAADVPAPSLPAGQWGAVNPLVRISDLPAGTYSARVCIHGFRCVSCRAIPVKIPEGKNPKLRPMGWGTFIDCDRSPHRWHINQAGTMIWDGKPYIPVGGMYLSPFFMGFNAMDPKRNEENWKTDIAKLAQLKAAGVTDLYLNPCNNWSDKPLWVWQRILDLFEDQGFHYGLQITNHLDSLKGYHIATGDYLVKPDGTKASADISQTFFGRTDEKTRVLYAAWSKNNTKVEFGEAKVIPAANGVHAEAELAAPADSVHFIPEFTFRGDMHDYWTSVNADYHEQIRKFIGGLRPGPGFRCFLDPLDNEQSWRDMSRMLPSCPRFQSMFTDWLKKEYPPKTGTSSQDLIRTAWAIDPAPTVDEAGRLVPLGTPSTESTTGWAVDPKTGKTFSVDLRKSKMWYDMVRFRDWSIRDFNNVTANWIKECQNVPVVLKLTDADTFTNNLTAGGFDGVGMEAYGSAPELVRGCGGGVFSRARRAGRTMWELVTETGMANPTDVFVGYPDPIRMATELSSMCAMGAKGVYCFYLNAAGDSRGSSFYSYNLFSDDRQLWWMGAFSKMMKQSTKLVDYLPVVDYFYPGMIDGQQGFAPPYKSFQSDIPSQSICGDSGRWVVPATTPPPPGSRVIVNLEGGPAVNIYGPQVQQWLKDGSRQVVFVGDRAPWNQTLGEKGDWQMCVREAAGPDVDPDFVKDVLGVRILDMGQAYEGAVIGNQAYIWNMTDSDLPIAQAVSEGNGVRKTEISPPPKAAKPVILGDFGDSEILGIDEANLTAAVAEWDRARAAAKAVGMTTSIVPRGNNWRDIYHEAARVSKEAELFGKTTTAAEMNGVTVDGDLSEWKSEKPLHCAVQVKQDFCVPVDYKDAGFYTGWDDGGIYLAGKVKDEAVVNRYKDKSIWNGDCVELFIDLHPDDQPENTNYNSGTYQFLLSPTNADGVPDAAVVNASLVSGYRPKNVKLAAKKTEDGWQFECYIPSSELGNWNPKAGDTIGFTLGLDDSDGGDRTSQYLWRGKSDISRNRSRFGRLKLAK